MMVSRGGIQRCEVTGKEAGSMLSHLRSPLWNQVQFIGVNAFEGPVP